MNSRHEDIFATFLYTLATIQNIIGMLPCDKVRARLIMARFSLKVERCQPNLTLAMEEKCQNELYLS
jgi:hypothetical protein